MSMNEKIKALYGQYEKILQNYEAIKSMNLDQQTKEIVKNDLQKRCKKSKEKMIEEIHNLPEIIISQDAPNIPKKEELVKNENVVKKIKSVEDPEFQEWKDWVGNTLRIVYGHDPKYIDSDEPLREVCDKMTNVYGVVWSQEYKENRWSNGGFTPKMKIIFNNKQYKSIFDSIVKNKYAEAMERDVVKVQEVITPLIELYDDKSVGGCATIKKIYSYMEERFNVQWERMIKRYKKDTGISGKKMDVLYWNDGLMERFRISVKEMLERDKL